MLPWIRIVLEFGKNWEKGITISKVYEGKWIIKIRNKIECQQNGAEKKKM
jgi:hypothetical protein